VLRTYRRAGVGCGEKRAARGWWDSEEPIGSAQHLPSGDGARLFDWLELLDDPDDVLAAYGAFGHSVVVLDVLVISIIRVPTVP